jgi:glucokinase
MSQQIGIDIGGTNLRIGVVQDLKVIYEQRIHADFASICINNPPDTALREIIEIVSHAIKQSLNNYVAIDSIGIGFPGFIDPKTGILASSPNLPGLMNIDLAKVLAKKIKRPVYIENDALAAAYGEYLLNKIPSSKGLIYIGLGTGIGGGLLHAGNLIAGEHGFAMEIGHIITHPKGRLCGCSNYGCLEQYASAIGISKNYQDLTGKQLDAHDIADLAKEGDSIAKKSYDIAGKSLAQALAHIVKIVDIEQVVIGGGVSKAWEFMKPAFDNQLNTDLIPVLIGKVQIHISNSLDQAGIIGSALLSKNKAKLL